MLCQAEQHHHTKYNSAKQRQTLTIEVTTGLCQGETLKLDDSPILIGGSQDCDIYLAEPGLSDAQLVAELVDNKVCISPLHNTQTDAYFGSGQLQKSIQAPTFFRCGESFCLGGVWLKVSSPVDLTKTATQKRAATNKKEQKKTIRPQTPNDTTLVSSSNKSCANSPQSKYEFGLNEDTDSTYQARINTQDDDDNFLRWAGLKAGSLFLSSIGICALTISVAQGVNKPVEYDMQEYNSSAPQSSYNSDTGNHDASDNTQSYGEALLADIRANISNETFNDKTIGNKTKTKPGPKLLAQGNTQLSHGISAHTEEDISVEEQLPYLKSVFSQMLLARELPSTVSLSYQNRQFIIEGYLDESKHDVLLRMISRFKTEQGIDKALINKVSTAFSSLPFEIVQVTSGRYGNIVTSAGDRLFVGDQLDGYQLVAIQNHQLVFTGKSRVTVAW